VSAASIALAVVPDIVGVHGDLSDHDPIEVIVVQPHIVNSERNGQER
jgi:hypothetical protein